MDVEVVRYLVVSYGFGVRDSKPSWYTHSGQAEFEIRKRLGVRRLRKDKRVLGIELDRPERTKIHDGFEWRCDYRYDLSKVPPAHPDYGRSGGVKYYKMVRGNSV